MTPNHLKLKSADGTKLNLEALYQIAPSCFTEVKDEKTGELRHVVNFTTLRQLLGDDAVDDAPEMYQFTWPGKQEARREAARPITDTLRPCPEESVDWDTTQNLYIEGDNLSVLKLLQKGYMGKVKMIYIDPPYNTGNDFVYHDDFAVSQKEMDLFSGDVDEEGNRYRKNTESNGRFHSDWCSMMYSRLLIARSLLTEDGVILISIDDNEIENCRKICDNIFGEANFIAQMIWQGGKVNTARFISTSHEYILVYAKDLHFCSGGAVEWRVKKTGLEAIYNKADALRKSCATLDEATKKLKQWYKDEAPEESKSHEHYCNIDNVGVYCMDNVSRVGGGKYSIINPINGLTINPPSRGWVFGKEEDLWKAYKDGILVFQDNDKLPILKRYLHNNELQLLDTVFYKDRRGARIRLKNLLDGEYFDFPKDEEVLKNLISAFGSEDGIVLDFFSGSGTTAHSVIQLNSEDSGKRRFICVQLNEETPNDSEARKAGYNTIPEIAKERIRRAGRKIKEESGLMAQNLDTGFRVFKLADSNFNEVYFSPKEVTQDILSGLESNIKEDRTDLDLLFGAMLDWGVQLSLPMSKETVDGCDIYTVNEGDLVACFSENITENVVSAMAAKMPLRVLFRDSCFSEDKAKINVFELFKQKLDWGEDEAIKNIRVI